jgi:hypothetical protein
MQRGPAKVKEIITEMVEMMHKNGKGTEIVRNSWEPPLHPPSGHGLTYLDRCACLGI